MIQGQSKHIMQRKILLAAALFASGSIVTATAAAAPAPNDDVIYRVKRGDTLETLGNRAFIRPVDYKIVQKRNAVRDPRQLPVGMALKIPSRLLRREPVIANIIALRGTVSINGKPAQANVRVPEHSEIRTGRNSFATIQLEDGSKLTMPSDSRLQVTALHRLILTNSIIKRFQLGGGRVETEATPLKKQGDRFEVRTPIAVAAIRGTRFRVSYDEAGSKGTTEVLKGRVAVNDAKQEAMVNAGQGVLVSPAAIGSVQALLPAPEPLNMGDVQDSEIVRFNLSPVADAAGYRVQLATDAGFIDLFAETDTATPVIEMSDVPNGSHFARISALSAGGLEGVSSVYSFDRQRNDVKTSVEEASACPAKRCMRFRWQAPSDVKRSFRFQLVPASGDLPLVDQADMTASEIVLTDLPAGTYRWRVESRSLVGNKAFAKWSEYSEFHVSKPRHK